jgi:UTP--glucose-1-phosphate uridylyltransferase
MVARVSSENQIGQLLRNARTRAGLTRGDLAQLVGLDTSYVYRIETGNRRPSRESLMALAEALGLNVDSINEWLAIAGYASASLLASVRVSSDSTDGDGFLRNTQVAGTRSEVVRWARWLETMGLHEATIGRLLRAMDGATPTRQREIARSIYSAISRVTESLEAPVHSAVIPAAGGQHQLLAPHVMQRLVLGVIDEAIESGIFNIVLVLAPGMAESLYMPLKAALDLTTSLPIKLSYCQQVTPLGLGDAILQAEPFVTQESFAVLLPDDMLREGKRIAPTLLHRMMDAFDQLGGPNLLAVTSVPKSKMWRYGVAKLSAKKSTAGVRSVKQLIEKPDHAQAILRSTHAFGIVGRYLLRPDIFPTLRALKESNGRLLQLTDALEHLRKAGDKVYAYEMGAIRQDIGEILGQASELIRGVQGAVQE